MIYRLPPPVYSKLFYDRKTSNDLLVGQCTNKKVKMTKEKFKKSVFEWKETQPKAFDTLNDKLINAPILAYTDYNLLFVLHTDASNPGLGAVLYQHQDGEDRVVASWAIREELSGSQTGNSGAQMGHYREVSWLPVWCCSMWWLTTTPWPTSSLPQNQMPPVRGG